MIVAALHNYSKNELLDKNLYQNHVQWFGEDAFIVVNVSNDTDTAAVILRMYLNRLFSMEPMETEKVSTKTKAAGK